MNHEYEEKWVAALRSGKYLQGQGALRQLVNGELRYCCLGVLCDVAGARWVVYTSSENGKSKIYEAHYRGSCSTSLIPKAMLSEVGFSSTIPRLRNGKAFSSLNDHYGLSFSEIADLIN